jgi:hypothetical protein
MVEAAQAAILVEPIGQRRAAVRTIFADEPELATRIAEGNEVLAQQAGSHRRSAALRQLLGHHGGDPVTPQQVAHRGARTDACQGHVIVCDGHACCSGGTALLTEIVVKCNIMGQSRRGASEEASSVAIWLSTERAADPPDAAVVGSGLGRLRSDHRSSADPLAQ